MRPRSTRVICCSKEEGTSSGMDSEPRLALFEHGNAVRQPADFAQFALDFPHVVKLPNDPSARLPFGVSVIVPSTFDIKQQAIGQLTFVTAVRTCTVAQAESAAQKCAYMRSVRSSHSAIRPNLLTAYCPGRWGPLVHRSSDG